MKLDNFMDKFLENVMSSGGIDQVRTVIKKDMKLCGADYDSTKVECQVYTNKNNYEPRVEINSEKYSDGEVIFLDYYVDEI